MAKQTKAQAKKQNSLVARLKKLLDKLAVEEGRRLVFRHNLQKRISSDVYMVGAFGEIICLEIC